MADIIKKVNGALVKAGLQPVDKNSALFYYMPMKGCVNYVLLSTQMASPELFENFKLLLVPGYISLTNACLLNTLTGTALYIYSRPHLANASKADKVMFCIFGSTMFNLGSMLMWALGRTVAPDNLLVRTVLGAGGAVGALYIGKKYVEFIDSNQKSS